MRKERLIQLLELYFDNKISEADCKELLDYLDTASEEELAIVDRTQNHDLESLEFKVKRSDLVFDRITNDPRFIGAKNNKRIFPRLSVSFLRYAAAILLVTVAFGLYEYSKHKQIDLITNIAQVSHQTIDKSKINLRSSNGKVISLATAEGYLNVDAKHISQVDQTGENHQLLVANNKDADNYFTLDVPKGTTYQIKLPDGSNVWLNSASSLTFPSQFNSKERKVYLTGEAYFEVAKHATKRFKVVSGENMVEVLGTHFNITAYKGDEHIITTLLEGSVKVAFKDAHQILKPGEQALAGGQSNTIIAQQANISSVMAWKNGYFDFQDVDLQTIMEQVERWYNVDVIYQGKVPPLKFGGTFAKTKGLNELLDHLEALANVHFKREERRVVVTF